MNIEQQQQQQQQQHNFPADIEEDLQIEFEIDSDQVARKRQNYYLKIIGVTMILPIYGWVVGLIISPFAMKRNIRDKWNATRIGLTKHSLVISTVQHKRYGRLLKGASPSFRTINLDHIVSMEIDTHEGVESLIVKTNSTNSPSLTAFNSFPVSDPQYYRQCIDALRQNKPLPSRNVELQSDVLKQETKAMSEHVPVEYL